MGKQEGEFGPLKEARYSNSGNSLGNMYYIETAYDDDGTFIVREADSPAHNERATIREYRAPADLLDRIDAIVNESGMKTWGDLPPSEYVLLDASTPTISLTYDSADPDDGFPIWISYTNNVVFPEGGEEAFYAIRDELSACATDENLIREYREAEREP